MATKQKPAHYRGRYHVQSAKLRQAAYANPSTTCWRCGRTLTEVRAKNPRAKWTAGHLIDGQPDGPLAPECSPCNFRAGQALAAQHRRKHRPQPPNVTDLTW